MEPFRASFLKIERAQQQIRELEYVAQQFLATDPVKWTTEIGPSPDNPRVALVKFSMHMPPVPEVMSAILGDIFHNLRSSLDLMASELARARGNSDDGVYFPFSGDEADLELMIKKRHFDRAGPNAIRLLKEMKPYKGGNVALRAIHDLNIQDKHQSLIVNVMEAGGPIIDTKPLKERGAAPVVVGDPTKSTDVKLLFPSNSALAKRELIPTLHELVQLATGIVEAFKALPVPSRAAPVGGKNKVGAGSIYPYTE